MERLLNKNGFDASMILPRSEVRVMADLGERVCDEAKIKAVIKRAEEEMQKPLLVIPASEIIEYYEGTHSEGLTGFAQRRMCAVVCALAEAYERKGRFVRRALDCVWAILEEMTWTHPAHIADRGIAGDPILPPLYINGLMHNIDLRSSSTAAILSFVYACLKNEFNALTPVINERIIHEVRERVLLPYVQRSFWWTGEYGGKVLNWGPWNSAKLLTAIMFLDVDEDLRRCVAHKAMDTLDNFTEHYPEDGGCDEGPGYWDGAGGSYFDALEMLYDLSGGRINVYHEPHIKRILEFSAKFNINATDSISFADCNRKNVYNGDTLRRMGEKCGSELLCSFGDYMNSFFPTERFIGTEMIYRMLRNLVVHTRVEERYESATKIWFPDLKVMAARACSDSSKGLFLAFKGGHNKESHNHNDVGSVIVYSDGKPVFIDMGAPTYTKKVFGKDRYTLKTHSSSYHNTVDIGGFTQLYGDSYRSRNEAYDENSGALTMQLREAFPEETGIISYERRAELIDGKVRITDSFDLENESEIDIHFLTVAEPKLLDGNKILLAEGRVMSYDSRLAAEVEYFEMGDERLADSWGTDRFWNIRLKTRTCKDVFVTTVE